MFGYTRDFDNAFDLMEQLQRRVLGVFDDFDGGRAEATTSDYPRTNLYDTGNAFVLTADLPGVGEKDFSLSLSGDVLVLSGSRKTTGPEGYSGHRRERGSFEFSRSYALPTKVDAEKTQATLKNGVLTVTLEKASEAKPRQITVRAS